MIVSQRCEWVQGKPAYYISYHDQVWGKPEHRDRYLFKYLLMETFHTGLSWQLVLSKEAEFEKAFDGFDYLVIAHYQSDKVASLLMNRGIIRHRGKIEASIKNAQAFLQVQADYGSFDHFIWSFTQGQVVERQSGEALAKWSDLSDQVTKVLKTYGFKYIGSVTIYSYLQAIGVINDHDLNCSFR